jgi:hypothetical protein
MTSLVRGVLEEYATRSKALEPSAGMKIDQFLERSLIAEATVSNHVFTPLELRKWNDAELLHTAKLLRARMQELSGELRKRKIFFSW